MKNIKLYYLFLLAFLAIGISSCDDDESLNSPISDIALGFDKTERTVLENGGSTIINVNFEAPALQSGTIVVSIQNLTASASDYSIPEAVGNQITFSISEGDSAVGFTFIPQDNDVVDGDKTIEFSLSAESANKLNVGAFFFKQKLTISDDESPKTVNFEIDSTNIKETDTESLEVKLTFSGMVSEPSVIKISQTTTNLTSANYTLNPASSVGFIELAIPVGATEASFTVTPIDNDEVGDLDQKIVFEIASATDGVIIIGEQNTTIVSITDDESTPEKISIADLRNLYTGTNITLGNFFIEGVVTSARDNTTGRNLVIQDATGAIVVRFNDDNTYELGQEISINVRNTQLEVFRTILQLNSVPNANAVLLGDGTMPQPEVITIAQLNENDTYQSRLIKLEGVTVQEANGTVTYDGNITITDGTNSVVAFTRGSASFSAVVIPTGNLDIVGIASSFNDVAQLNIRQESDVTAAGSGGGGGGSGATSTPIADIRSRYSGADVSITEDTFIQGVVTSSNDNITGRNLFIQDANAGIELRFENNNTLTLGEEVRVNLNGGTITRFNEGSLQVEGIDNTNAVSQGMGTLPTPITITVAQLLSKDFEGQLVRVEGLTVVADVADATEIFPSFGNLVFSRGGDTFNSFIRDTSFSGNALPTGTVSVVGIASTFGNVGQITLRQESDIQ